MHGLKLKYHERIYRLLGSEILNLLKTDDYVVSGSFMLHVIMDIPFHDIDIFTSDTIRIHYGYSGKKIQTGVNRFIYK